MGKLRHPNIVTAHDAGEIDNVHFLAMECVDGTDLDFIGRMHSTLSIGNVCELGRQIARGLEHGHKNGIVHRDVKPSNLILTRGAADAERHVKILDFGLACLQANVHGADQLTTSRQIVGTVQFMAPEQASEHTEVDGRADIYGLGATLFAFARRASPTTT